jgi:two-component system sensor histidine kinase CpxA
MKARPTLTKKIFFLAFLNLSLLGLLLLVFASVEFRFQADSLLMVPAEGRISSARAALSSELEQSPAEQRDAILAAYSKSYGVTFMLVDDQAHQIGGPSVLLPEEVRDRIIHPEPPRGGHRPLPPPPRRQDERPGDGYAPPRRPPPPPLLPPNPPLFLVTSHHPTLYWVGQRMPIRSSSDPRVIPGALLLISPSLFGTSIFFDVRPWLALVCGVILLSIACWMPFIRGLTKSVRGMSDATAHLAEGRFDIQLPQDRTDELGQLAASINCMAAQLQGFVQGQKRFLGDTAHELCAPIARLQFALGILEQQTEPAKHKYLADLQEEVQHMSGLVNELLSFSKASMQKAGSEMVRVNLADMVDRVLAREKPGQAQIEVQVNRELAVEADPECVFRSLSNLVRNALRYAGDAGPIAIAAAERNHQVYMTVTDCGPGLPEDALEEIFKPFYRPERARTRESGGTGLGLAIVKTCVESCQGTVVARNRQPTGLEVEIRLPRAFS